MSQSLVLEGTWNLNHLPSRLVGFCVTKTACRVPAAFGPAPLQKDDVCLGDPDHAMSFEPQTGCFCGKWTVGHLIDRGFETSWLFWATALNHVHSPFNQNL